MRIDLSSSLVDLASLAPRTIITIYKIGGLSYIDDRDCSRFGSMVS